MAGKASSLGTRSESQSESQLAIWLSQMSTGLLCPCRSAALSKCKCHWRSGGSGVRCHVARVTLSDTLEGGGHGDNDAAGTDQTDWKEPTAAKNLRSYSDIFCVGVSGGVYVPVGLLVCLFLCVHSRQACHNHFEGDWWWLTRTFSCVLLFPPSLWHVRRIRDGGTPCLPLIQILKPWLGYCPTGKENTSY